MADLAVMQPAYREHLVQPELAVADSLEHLAVQQQQKLELMAVPDKPAAASPLIQYPAAVAVAVAR